ncbi:MAG: FAD-dependent oxidoreductase [Desulfurobacteriaceae bacterium]
MFEADREFALKGFKTLKKRKRAFYLSLILPGLGQIYSGRTVTGVLIGILFLFPFYYLYLIGWEVNYGTVTLLLSQLFLYSLQAVDAKRGSRRETSPCEDSCPAGVNIPTLMSYTESGDLERAVASFMTKAPFPFILGQIGPAYCEKKGGIITGRPLKIREVHEKAAEIVLKSLEVKDRDPFLPEVNKKVAVIGGGIAGLTVAYYLASAGVKVELFEKEGSLGGILKAIPSFKLNRKLAEKEIALVTAFKNLKVHTGIEISSLPEGFNAIVVAVGSQTEKKLKVKGDKVLYPLQFLRETPNLKGKRVLIIGAGDTAFDVARLTVRKGGKAVVIYRGRRENIRAQEREVTEAIKEGVRIYTECELVNLSGNRAELNCGSFEFDYLIPAIGFEKDWKLFKKLGISGKERKEGKVFLTGDAFKGMSTAVEAVGEARKTAEEVLKYLNLKERAWFSIDFYREKQKRISGGNVFLVSEASLCQHCGEKVKS